MFQRFLTLVDGSNFGTRALPYAAWLAAATHGEVLLVRATTADEQREDIERELAREVVRLRRRGFGARAVVYGHEEKRTADMLLAVQQVQRADLIVLATHGGRGPGRALWGSTADDVLRRSPVPVLLVPKRSAPAWPRRRPLRVLLTLDGADPAEQALLLVNHLPVVTTIQLYLTAMDPVDRPAPDTGEWDRPSPSTSPETLSQRLGAIARLTQAAGMETSVHVGLDYAAARLAEVARDEHSDVIVMATSGRHGAMRALFGGAARDVLYRLPVPLLVTRPDETALASDRPSQHPPSAAGPL
jgi:nucleotide-binding universal stress UspA family protein